MWARRECVECDGDGQVLGCTPCASSGLAPDARCSWCNDYTELGADSSQGIFEPICESCWDGRQAADRARELAEGEGSRERLPFGTGYCEG